MIYLQKRKTIDFNAREKKTKGNILAIYSKSVVKKRSDSTKMLFSHCRPASHLYSQPLQKNQSESIACTSFARQKDASCKVCREKAKIELTLSEDPSCLTSAV